MIWLNSSRYVATWIKKIPSRNIIFNPEYLNAYQEAMIFWDHAFAYKGVRQNFVNIFKYLTATKAKRIQKKTNLNFSFLSQLPHKTILTQKEYETFLKSVTPLFSERFIHYDSAHFGSSRHVTFGSVQAKGVGRNMLVSRVDYTHAWGGASELEGVYSYLISNLLNLQLPAGACPTFKVDLLKNGSAQLLRVNNSLRVSQYSRFLMESEKLKIKEHLEEMHQSYDPYVMKKKIAFQFAMSSFINCYNYSMISENILLNGAFIDCESIYNGKNLKALTFCLDLSIEGKRSKSIDVKKLENWDYLEKIFSGKSDTKLCNSSFHGTDFILRRLQEVYKDLILLDSHDIRDEYWNSLNQLTKCMSGQELSGELVKLLKDFVLIPCEVSHREANSFTFNWKECLDIFKAFLDETKPLSVFFIAKEDHQIFIRVSLNLKRSAFSDPLLAAFNIKNRMNMHYEAALSIQKGNKLDSVSRASMLNHDINRATFCIPFDLNSKPIFTSRKELTKHLKRREKNQKSDAFKLSIAYIDEYGKYCEKESLFNEVPEFSDFIVYEISRTKDNFKFLTRPQLVRG